MSPTRKSRPSAAVPPAAPPAAPALPPLSADAIGLEGRLVDADHQALKVWLRLLACSTQIETEIRRRLRAGHGMTLARFDYLAQLHRHPDGLRMNALSRYLMVTGGNVTALTDELTKAGWVRRDNDPADRRSFRVALTASGRRAFERVAREHEAWVIELLGGLDAAGKQQLHGLLGGLRQHLSRPAPDEETPA